MWHSIYRRTFFLFIKLRKLCLVRCTLQVPFCLELAAVNFYNYYLVSVFVSGFYTFLIFFFVFVLFLLADNSQVNLTCVKCVLEIPVLYPLVVDALADHMTKFLFDQSNRNVDALVKRPYRRYSEAFSFGM